MSLATLMLASSCTSSYQAAGGLTGAMIGSHVGSAVGFLSGSGRYRGDSSALGSLIGMGVGAILGVGIASQIEENEKAEAKRYEERANEERTSRNSENGYYGDADYQIGGGAYDGGTYNGASSQATFVSLSELSYMDADGDGCISKDETIEVEGYITNTSNSVLNDIVINLEVSDPKAFSISPSLTTNLQPGQKIRYTGRVHCLKTRRNQSVNINLVTTYAGKSCSSTSLIVRTI
mgnify:CR=1 FL=1